MDPRVAEHIKSRSQIAADKQQIRAADIRYNSDVRPASVQRITLSADQLGTAVAEGNPLVIPFPFDSFHVEAATDQTVEVKLSLGSERNSRSIQNYKAIKLNDAGVCGSIQTGCALTWSAQSGKTMTIVFFIGFAFNPGSQLSLTAGGVSVSSGSAVTNAVVTLAAAAATAIFAQDATRKQGTWINDTGITQYAGPVGVTATGSTKGLPVLPGATFVWQNTAALYLYNTGAAFDTVAMSET